MRHGAFGSSNVNADLRVRNTWVTSVDVTMKTRARKAVLLHLGEGWKTTFKRGESRRTSFRGRTACQRTLDKIEQTQTSCMNSES